jgi:hypothetical protein
MLRLVGRGLVVALGVITAVIVVLVASAGCFAASSRTSLDIAAWLKDPWGPKT